MPESCPVLGGTALVTRDQLAKMPATTTRYVVATSRRSREELNDSIAHIEATIYLKTCCLAHPAGHPARCKSHMTPLELGPTCSVHTLPRAKLDEFLFYTTVVHGLAKLDADQRTALELGRRMDSAGHVSKPWNKP